MNVKRDHSPTLLGASAATSAATLSSRLFGLVRDATLASVFPKELTDVFWACFRIPNTFRQIFGEGAVSVAFLPTFVKMRKEGGNEAARVLFGAVLHLLVLATGLVSLVGIVLAPWILDLLLSFPEEEGTGEIHQTAIGLIRWMFPYLILVCCAALIGGVLNATGRFFVAAASPAFFSLSIVATALVAYFASGLDVQWLAWGALAGGSLQVVAQLPSLWRSGMTPLWRGKFSKTKGLHQVFGLFLPATLGLGVKQINTLVNTYFASTLGKGPISYLFYADRITQLPLAVFGFSIATASFPKFSSSALDPEGKAICTPLSRSMKGTILVLVPSTVVLCVFGGALVDLLFNRGRFAAEGSLVPTVAALRVYALGLVPFAFLRLFGNLSFALGDGKGPLVAGLTAALANVLLAHQLRHTFLAHSGIALAVVLASLVNLSVLLFRLRKRIQKGWFLGLLPLLGRVTLASAVMGAVLAGWLTLSAGLPVLVVVAVGLCLGGATYLACGMLLFREHIRRLLNRASV